MKNINESPGNPKKMTHGWKHSLQTNLWEEFQKKKNIHAMIYCRKNKRLKHFDLKHLLIEQECAQSTKKPQVATTLSWQSLW